MLDARVVFSARCLKTYTLHRMHRHSHSILARIPLYYAQQKHGDALAPETSIFTEPLRWMEGITGGAVQGKLYCPSCQARLGSFNWSGSQASSGRWVVPAFQLHLSKLDEEAPASHVQHAIRCGAV